MKYFIICEGKKNNCISLQTFEINGAHVLQPLLLHSKIQNASQVHTALSATTLFKHIKRI